MGGHVNAQRQVYLKPGVLVEPLVNDWYAWGYLVSPATAAMLTRNLHVRVLESFIRAPQLHRRAVAEAAMRGGMFLDYDGDVANVEGLLAATRETMSPQLAFAEAVQELDQLIQDRKEAGSLASLYECVPEALAGTVELFYDLRHQLSYRFIEPLLYASPVYDESLQALRLSAQAEHRPFVLSSPRFDDGGGVKLDVAFASPWVDLLSRARWQSISLSEAHGLLEQQGDGDVHELTQALFTEQAPTISAQPRPTSGMRVRYFGHATLLIESPEVSILVDPVVAYPDYEGPDRLTLFDLPEHIDYVLLTHNHQDHVMLETLLQLRHRIDQIVVPRGNGGALQDPSLRLMLEAVGFSHVRELDEFGTLVLPTGAITGVPFLGEHADLDIRSKLAYCVSLEQRRVLVLADSNNLDRTLYRRTKALLGDIDAMFIGLECDGAPLSWLYGPLFTRAVSRTVDHSRRLNSSDCEAALEIIDCLQPAAVYVYAMAMEPWIDYISSVAYTDESLPIVESSKLVQACQGRGMEAERLYLTRDLHL